MKRLTKVAWLTAIGLSVASSQVGAQTPSVQILAYGTHFGGQVVYRYQVRNNTSGGIDAVTLGVPSPGKELPGIPWKADTSLSDVPTEVPLSQCKPFVNMTCSVALFQFDYMSSPKAVIEMLGRELTQTPPPAVFSKSELIPPGATSSVAEVYVPVGDLGYLSASGTVRFFNNHPKDASGKPIIEFEVPFTRADTARPSISGHATATKRGGMLDVTIALQVSDNLDSNPAVVLASVTSNEQLHPRDVQAVINTDTRTIQLKRNKGRIYYLTYRATDGSGNTNSVVITVPGELP